MGWESRGAETRRASSIDLACLRSSERGCTLRGPFIDWPAEIFEDVNQLQAPGNKPKIGLVLIGGASEGGGGTGRRFARLFQHFQRTPSRSNVSLVTTPEFLELMERSSIPIDANKNVIYCESTAIKSGAGPLDKLGHYRDASAKLASLVTEHEFDVVHIPIPNLLYAPYLLDGPEGVRHVFSMTAAVGSFDSMHWKSQLLYRIGFEACDAIDTLYSDIAERFPSYANKLHVSPCSFTDYSHYQPANEKERSIVFAGRLEGFKNPELFVEATSLAADVLRQHRWTCKLFGDGELRARVEAQIAHYGLSDLIEIDQVPDLSSELNRSSIFTSIQLTENYPSQVLLEAMAAGNAVIATDVGETRKIVDEEVGLLFDPQTPENLAQAMTRLVSDDALRDRLASNARDRILEEHTVERFAAYMENLWVAALADPMPSPRLSRLRTGRLIAEAAAGLKFA